MQPSGDTLSPPPRHLQGLRDAEVPQPPEPAVGVSTQTAATAWPHSCFPKAQKVAKTQVFPVSFSSFHAKDGEGCGTRRRFFFTLICFEIPYT